MNPRRFVGYKVIFNYSLTDEQMADLVTQLEGVKLVKFVMPIERSAEGSPDTIPEEVQ